MARIAFPLRRKGMITDYHVKIHVMIKHDCTSVSNILVSNHNKEHAFWTTPSKIVSGSSISVFTQGGFNVRSWIIMLNNLKRSFKKLCSRHLLTRRSLFLKVAGYLRREGLSHGEGEESHEAMMQEIFQEEDKNKDGYISHDEFQGLKHGEL